MLVYGSNLTMLYNTNVIKAPYPNKKPKLIATFCMESLKSEGIIITENTFGLESRCTVIIYNYEDETLIECVVASQTHCYYFLTV